jgi:hypothetical protein
MATRQRQCKGGTGITPVVHVNDGGAVQIPKGVERVKEGGNAFQGLVVEAAVAVIVIIMGAQNGNGNKDNQAGQEKCPWEEER